MREMKMKPKKYQKWGMDALWDYRVLADMKTIHRVVIYKRLQKPLTKVHYEQGRNI